MTANPIESCSISAFVDYFNLEVIQQYKTHNVYRHNQNYYAIGLINSTEQITILHLNKRQVTSKTEFFYQINTDITIRQMVEISSLQNMNVFVFNESISEKNVLILFFNLKIAHTFSFITEWASELENILFVHADKYPAVKILCSNNFSSVIYSDFKNDFYVLPYTANCLTLNTIESQPMHTLFMSLSSYLHYCKTVQHTNFTATLVPQNADLSTLPTFDTLLFNSRTDNFHCLATTLNHYLKLSEFANNFIWSLSIDFNNDITTISLIRPNPIKNLLRKDSTIVTNIMQRINTSFNSLFDDYYEPAEQIQALSEYKETLSFEFNTVTTNSDLDRLTAFSFISNDLCLITVINSVLSELGCLPILKHLPINYNDIALSIPD